VNISNMKIESVQLKSGVEVGGGLVYVVTNSPVIFEF